MTASKNDRGSEHTTSEMRRAGGRHHDPDVLDPAALADLAALDAALAGEPGGAEWAALVGAVRAEPPAPRGAFTRELDERAAAGFPRRRPARLRVPALPGGLVPALAVALVALLVAGIAGLGGLGGGEDQEASAPSGGVAGSVEPGPERGGGSAASSAAPARAQDSGAAAPSGAPPTLAAPSASTAAPLARRAAGPRRVVRSTTLELRTSAPKLQEVADGVVRTTQDLGGVVERSSVDGGPGGGTGSFALRVPVARLPEALERLGGLAAVGRLSQGTEDVTGAFVSTQDRLSDARAERRALLAALPKATTPRAIASLRARLAGNRAEVARLEGDLRGLRRRTDAARIDVTLTAGATGAALPSGDDGRWGPGDAGRDALRVLELLAGVALLAGAVLVPLGLLGAAAALAGRAARRRRREDALGAA